MLTWNDLRETLQSTGVQFLIAVFSMTTAVLSWYVRVGIEKFPWFSRQWKRFFNCFCFKKVVYLWCDDEETKRVWQNSLHTYDIHNHRENFRIIPLEAPRDILQYPLPKKKVLAVIFLGTNTMRYAFTKKDREATEEHVLKYVEKGGIFLSSHDALYRRVNNRNLRETMSYQTDTFYKTYTQPHREDEVPVTYVINKSCQRAQGFFNQVFQYAKEHGIMKVDEIEKIRANGSFPLSDSEIAYSPQFLDAHTFPGADTLVICHSKRGEIRSEPNREVPLFIVKYHHRGLFFWINSGDRHLDGQCNSLGRFEPMLKAIVTYIIYNGSNLVEKAEQIHDNDIQVFHSKNNECAAENPD